jgi:hypothetical protein
MLFHYLFTLLGNKSHGHLLLKMFCSNSIKFIVPSDATQTERKEDQTIANVATPKKEKKNTNYKAHMAGITSGSGASQDIDSHRGENRVEEAHLLR